MSSLQHGSERGHRGADGDSVAADPDQPGIFNREHFSRQREAISAAHLVTEGRWCAGCSGPLVPGISGAQLEDKSGDNRGDEPHSTMDLSGRFLS